MLPKILANNNENRVILGQAARGNGALLIKMKQIVFRVAPGFLIPKKLAGLFLSRQKQKGSQSGRFAGPLLFSFVVSFFFFGPGADTINIRCRVARGRLFGSQNDGSSAQNTRSNATRGFCHYVPRVYVERLNSVLPIDHQYKTPQEHFFVLF
jgi:hypothetical protein